MLTADEINTDVLEAVRKEYKYWEEGIKKSWGDRWREGHSLRLLGDFILALYKELAGEDEETSLATLLCDLHLSTDIRYCVFDDVPDFWTSVKDHEVYYNDYAEEL